MQDSKNNKINPFASQLIDVSAPTTLSVKDVIWPAKTMDGKEQYTHEEKVTFLQVGYLPKQGDHFSGHYILDHRSDFVYNLLGGSFNYDNNTSEKDIEEHIYPQVSCSRVDCHPPIQLAMDEKLSLDEETIVEPLLIPDEKRWSPYPIRHEWAFQLYQQHVASFWTPGEIDFSRDMQDWKTLNHNEQHFILTVLSFFACSDGIVMENIIERFMCEVQVYEMRSFYSFQLAMEAIHAQTYGLLIETYTAGDEPTKQALFNAIVENPAIKAKADWTKYWITSGIAPFAQRLLAFAIVECIFFTSSFCAIFWFKKRGKLPGLCFANEFISRDESLHVTFAIQLYKKLQLKVNQMTLNEMFHQAVRIEDEYVDSCLPKDLLGMNRTMMKEYVRFVANWMLQELGEEPVFLSLTTSDGNIAKNPFPWMDMLSLQGKTNFFEKRVGEYQKAGILNDDEVNNLIDFDELDSMEF